MPCFQLHDLYNRLNHPEENFKSKWVSCSHHVATLVVGSVVSVGWGTLYQQIWQSEVECVSICPVTILQDTALWKGKEVCKIVKNNNRASMNYYNRLTFATSTKSTLRTMNKLSQNKYWYYFLYSCSHAKFSFIWIKVS